MNSPLSRSAAFLPVLVALFLVSFLGIDEANAGFWCDTSQDTAHWSVPHDGAQVTPETRILLVIRYQNQGEEISVADASGEPVEGDLIKVEMGHRMDIWPSAFLEFVPQAPLADGEYTVTFEEGTELFEFTFDVDTSLDSPATPEAVSFEWFTETGGFQEDECGSGQEELQYIAIEPLDEAPAYYEIFIDHVDGSETVQLVPSDARGGELNYYTIEGVDCVTVTAHHSDGTAGEATQYCEPHKCMHYPVDDEAEFGNALGTTDWDNVDGCDEDENGGEEQDVGDGADEEDEEDEEDENSSCSTTGSSQIPGLLVLVTIGLIGMRRLTPRASLA